MRKGHMGMSRWESRMVVGGIKLDPGFRSRCRIGERRRGRLVRRMNRLGMRRRGSFMGIIIGMGDISANYTR